jgi:GNAT superfamily N-acetyltransferase
MIRRATAADVPRVLEMAARFIAETPYRDLIGASATHLADVLENVMADEYGVVLLSGTDAIVAGMIVVIVRPHPYSGESTAFELVWWVDPESRGDGIRLLRAAEAWATERGVTRMQMVAPDVRVGALYERLGYQAIEVAYQRSL